ncbi:MAG: hypothetical protein WBA51_10970 [Erythrobacter sp.]
MAVTPVGDPDRGGRGNTFMRLLDAIAAPAIEHLGREFSIGAAIVLGLICIAYVAVDD